MIIRLLIKTNLLEPDGATTSMIGEGQSYARFESFDSPSLIHELFSHGVCIVRVCGCILTDVAISFI
jgi:hypothetical protein